MTFHVISDHVVSQRYVNAVRYSATQPVRSAPLTKRFFLFSTAARSRLSAVGEVYGDEGDAMLGLPARNQAKMKSKQHRINLRNVETNVAQRVWVRET